MKIVIAGCGKIGTTILSSLVAEGHNIVAIDDNPAVITELTNVYDVMGICGNGSDCDILKESGIEDAELFIAVTGTDELNMLSCFLAKRMGAKQTIARIRNPEYNDKSLSFVKQQLNLSMAINPDLLAAQELYNILKLPSAVKIETFSRSNFELIELKLRDNSALDGMKLSDIRTKYKSKFLVCVVQRREKVFIPDGSFVLKSGDRIGLTATPAEIQKFMRDVGIMQKTSKNVMILGGSRTAFYLAKMLLASGLSVKIIERDKAVCREICEALPKAVVINGDGAQQELLAEEGIQTTDAFVALTGMDEENILISFFASAQNVPKVISKVNRSELASMAERLGLDCIISPKDIITNIIVRYARALENSLGSNVETLYSLMDGKAEAVEFNVGPEFKLTNVPLKELNLKQNILVAGIIRDRRPMIPAGDDTIQTGDRIIVIAADMRLQDLSDIFR